MLFVRQASQRQLRKHEDMLWMQVRDLLLKGMPAGALEEGRRPPKHVQRDPGAPPQNGGRREWIVGEYRWGRGGVENKCYKIKKNIFAGVEFEMKFLQGHFHALGMIMRFSCFSCPHRTCDANA